jgi:hypothetical protein
MTRILTDSELEEAVGGVSWERRMSTFNEANRRWTEIVNKGGPGAANSPKAQKLDRLMKTIDAYPYPYKRGVTY